MKEQIAPVSCAASSFLFVATRSRLPQADPQVSASDTISGVVCVT